MCIRDSEKAFYTATVGTGGATGDFEETAKKQPRQERPRTNAGERGDNRRGGRGGDRGGRGGDRGGRGGRGGRRALETDAEGNPVVDRPRRERQPFRGKPREDAHPYDRKDGTGRAHRGDKKDGHGKGNWGGAKDDKVYKKKGEETEERAAEEETKEEAPVKKAPPKQEYVEEILGYSLDDFMKDKTVVGKKAERASEGIKGQKVVANDATKVKQTTIQQNQYLKGAVAKTTGENALALGLTGDDEERGYGGNRGGRNQEGGQRGGRRGNAKQALRKTEEDFPSL